MVEQTAPQYYLVQGLMRGMEVLIALNRMPGGIGSAVELSTQTRLHRTTVKRLLETLRAAGFVMFIPESNGYRLTFRVAQLAEGFRPEVWIYEVARPLIRAMTERILWPCNLLTREQDHLVVQDSSHHFSPLSFHSGAAGTVIPMVRTAAGRAYLAFCGEEERDLLLALLRSRDDAEGGFARDERTVRKILEATRERGFAINEGDWIGRGRYGAIGAPIMAGGRVIGCLDVVFSKRAIKVAEAAKKYAPDLLATARAIESGVVKLAT